MSFMQAQITDKQYWLQVDGDCGTESIPEMLFDLATVVEIIGTDDADLDSALLPVIGDYLETSHIYGAEIVQGYGVRSSAPGYMDCTSWAVYTNKREALAAARQEQRGCDGLD